MKLVKRFVRENTYLTERAKSDIKDLEAEILIWKTTKIGRRIGSHQTSNLVLYLSEQLDDLEYLIYVIKF